MEIQTRSTDEPKGATAMLFLLLLPFVLVFFLGASGIKAKTPSRKRRPVTRTRSASTDDRTYAPDEEYTHTTPYGTRETMSGREAADAHLIERDR